MLMRMELNDILYPGALTSRQKRYAAEPAPDRPNLTSISERTANGSENPGPSIVETDRPVVRRSRTGMRPDRPRRTGRATCSRASGKSRKEYPRPETCRQNWYCRLVRARCDASDGRPGLPARI